MKYIIARPSDRMARCLGVEPEDTPEAVVTSGALFLYESWDGLIISNSSEVDVEIGQHYCIVRDAH
jgi:hypothetical protein